MKRIFTVVIAIFSFSFSGGQAIIKSFKAQGWPMEAITSIKPTLDGGFVIAGDLSDTFSTYHSKVFLIKLDSSYNFVWGKKYDSGDPYGDIRKMDISSDSGFLLICNNTTGFLNPYGLAIIKTDSKGNFLWERTYPGFEEDVYSRTSDGGYILGGETSGAGHTIMGLTKIDSAFNLQWSYAYACVDSLASAATSIKETADHGFIIVGDLLSITNKYHAILLVKTDSLGIPQWSKSYSGSAHFNSSDEIILDTDSGFTIGGLGSSVIDSAGDVVDGELLIKTDKSGNMLWGNIYNEFAWISNLEKSTDGGYYIYMALSVSKSDSLGNLEWTKSYNSDPSFIDAYDYSARAYYQLDSNNFILCSAIGVVQNEQAFFMKTTSQKDSCTFLVNNIATYPYKPTVDTVVFTLTAQYGQDTVASASSDLTFTDSILCSNGVYTAVQNIDKPINATTDVKLYPNPSTGRLTLAYQLENEEGILQLFDIVGKNVGEFILEGKKSEFEFDMGDICCGIFEYRVIDGNILIARDKLVLIR